MKKTVKYIHLAVSTTAKAALIIARGKLGGIIMTLLQKDGSCLSAYRFCL